MTNHLRSTIRQHKAGESVGVFSVCSAHPMVLEAALRQAAGDDTYVLIEATSNQVDQFGGYTGMRPADFRDFVFGIADGLAFDRDRIVLGGDHLGPNRWQQIDPIQAMDNAEELVRAYVHAGYSKIHLDCSMRLQGDATVLTDELVAGRTARLLAAAEEEADGASEVLYVIGTEVPVPGGAHETLGDLLATPPADARETIASHRAAFAAAGLSSVWPRIIAIVVQPAVEFDHLKVVDYRRELTTELRHVIDSESELVFEAHSTDYQTATNLARLVEDDWAILKVGPGLTFALREALFALAAIEDELVDAGERSQLVAVIETVMLDRPGYWEGYYEGSESEKRIARRFSYSDRMRYYWPDETIVAAEKVLHANLAASDIPLPLISQYLPVQYERVRDGLLEPTAHELVIDRIRDVLRPYAFACSGERRRYPSL